MSSDWMAMALERFQIASRSVRMTLPPCRHEVFWDRLVELARLKRRGLSITVQLPANPDCIEGLVAALKALPQLEASGHEVSWAATTNPLPYSFFMVDDVWSLVLVGDPEDSDGGCYIRLTDNGEESKELRHAFDRRVLGGTWGVDPEQWLEWLEALPHRRNTRAAINALERGERKLNKAVHSAMRTLPKRKFWVIKPRESAYGIAGKDHVFHWKEWFDDNIIGIGWSKMARFVKDDKLPAREDFVAAFLKKYPEFKAVNKAYAAYAHFFEEMNLGDRILSLDGWTSRQKAPVFFQGWGRIVSDVQVRPRKLEWPIVREVKWQPYLIRIPVGALREASGLRSCTSPMHQLTGRSFHNVLDLADEVMRSGGQPQLALELTLNNKVAQQQELL